MANLLITKGLGSPKDISVPLSRIGDIWAGVCCCHSGCVGMSGPIVTGSPNAISESSPVARITDITIGTCGHTGVIVSGSTVNFTNSLGKAFIGSNVTGCNIGVVVSGASTQSTG